MSNPSTSYILKFPNEHKLEGESFSFANNLVKNQGIRICDEYFEVQDITYEIKEEFEFGVCLYKSYTYLWLW